MSIFDILQYQNEDMGQVSGMDDLKTPGVRLVKKPVIYESVPTTVKEDYQNDLNIGRAKETNGNYLRLSEQKYTLNGPLKYYTYDNQISPNVIRNRDDPYNSIPTLQAAQTTTFTKALNRGTHGEAVSLLKRANLNYAKYMNRYF